MKRAAAVLMAGPGSSVLGVRLGSGSGSWPVKRQNSRRYQMGHGFVRARFCASLSAGLGEVLWPRVEGSPRVAPSSVDSAGPF